MKSVTNWNISFYFLDRFSAFKFIKIITVFLLLKFPDIFCSVNAAELYSSESDNIDQWNMLKKQDFNLMSGVHLNYLIYNNPPFDNLIRKPDGNYTFYGSSQEMLKWIAKRYNFTFSLIPVNETLVDKLGTNGAIFYQLINEEEVDAVNSGFIITIDRKEKVDFTYAIWAEADAITVPKPGEESRLFAFIRPFQPMVWLMILVSVIAIVGLMTFLSWYYERFPVEKANNTNSSLKTRRNFTFDFFSFHMIYVLNIMTNQGGREWSSRHSFRIVAGFWVLAGMVLVNSYSGTVISSLTVPKMKPAIESLEDLAKSEEVGVILRSDVVIGSKILSATSGVYKAIGDKARSGSGLIFTDNKLIPKLATGNYAYPFMHTFAIFFIANQYKKDGHCRFQLSKISNAPSDGYYHSPMKKGNPYVSAISKGYMDLWEFGLIPYFIKEITPKAYACFATKKTDKSVHLVPIHTYDLISAFLILGIGLGLATLTFLLELIYARVKRHF